MKKSIVMAAICLLPASYAAAEGYQANAQSTKQSGMGHVGAAMKLGAESMHFNPAGLGFMDKTIDISAGVSAVFAKANLTIDGTKHKSDNGASTPLYVYAGFKIYDNLSGGISLTTPYGSAMNWGVNWPGSNLVQEITLKSYSVQPTISYKMFDRLSIGAGLMVMFGDFSLSRSLIGAGDLEKLRFLSPALGQYGIDLDSELNKYKDISAVSATLSGNTNVKVGYNLGVMFDVNDKITLGVSYRSKVNMRVPEGHAVLDYVNETDLKGLIELLNPILGEENAIIIPPLDRGTFDASLPLPSNWNIGVTYQPNKQWLLSGEVQFVGWGAYKTLNISFDQVVIDEIYSIVAPKEYKNSRIYRLGAQYAATNRLDLRLGTYLDESPVKSDYLNPETPSMNKLGITAGFSFRPLEYFSVDVALAYLTGFGRDGSYTDQLSGVEFGGHYKVNAFTPSVGVSYAF